MIHLPKPCPVKWDSMSPADGGRNCSVCEKVIPDFTNKSEEEILEALRNGVTCGSFNSSQVTDGSTYGGWTHFLNWKTGIAMLVAGSMFMFSCAGRESHRTTGVVYTPQYHKTTKGYKKKREQHRKFLVDNSNYSADDSSSK